MGYSWLPEGIGLPISKSKLHLYCLAVSNTSLVIYPLFPSLPSLPSFLPPSLPLSSPSLLDPSLPDPSLPDPSLPDPSLPDPSLPLPPSLPPPSFPPPSFPPLPLSLFTYNMVNSIRDTVLSFQIHPSREVHQFLLKIKFSM